GVRTDVRVVCLNLLNAKWYILQMRDRQTHESPPLPINLTDEEIDALTSGSTPHEPHEIVFPVNKELLTRAFSSDNFGIDLMDLPGIERNETFEYQLQSAVPYSIPVDS